MPGKAKMTRISPSEVDRLIFRKIFGVLIILLSLCANLSYSDADAGPVAYTDWSEVCGSCTCWARSGLKHADCSSKKLNHLPGDLTEEIQSLNLTQNDIYSLKSGAFPSSGLTNLRRLTLQKNILQGLEPNAFEGLKGLLYLDLSYNRLEHIDPMTFSPLGNLQELKLNNNPLKRFDSNQFPPMKSLIFLDLSYCNFQELPWEIFRDVNQLQDLRLDTNRFTGLERDVLDPLHSLRALYLQGNPWACDCHLRDVFNWARNWKLAQKTPCGDGIRVWNEMSVQDFYCPPNITGFTVSQNGEILRGKVISVRAGSDLSFECEIEADPAAEIVWLRNNNELTSSSKYQIETRGSTTKYSRLNLENLDVHDGGRFTCRGIQEDIRNQEITMEVVIPVTAGVGPSPSRGKSGLLWLWILLGLVGLLLLLAFTLLLVFYCLKRKRANRKTHHTSQEKVIVPHRDVVKQGPDQVDTPLLQQTQLQQAPPPSERILMLQQQPPEDHYTELRAQTPMPFSPSAFQHGTLPRQEAVPLGQLQPAGYATYNPRLQQYEINFRRPYPHHQQAIPGRMYSPYSGSVASFTSEPPVNVPSGPGYVTLPRRRRVPMSPNVYGRNYVPPSPTGSLPPNLRSYRYGPDHPIRSDSVGPRTTADGGSNLSLNTIGLPPPPMSATGNFGGNMTPATPASARLPRSAFSGNNQMGGRIPKSSTSLQNYSAMPSVHFNFEPIQEHEPIGLPV